jgi:hypothetical protein
LPPAGRSACLRLHPPGDPQRDTVQRTIDAVYREHFGARVPDWAPMLVSIGHGDTIAAAAGYRRATGTLYLERYLSGPIERVLARALGIAPPDRARIVEVGHLAAVRPGASRVLMAALGAHLAASGADWVVSTATAPLRAMFERMGMTTVELGRASARAAGPQAGSWGSYYAAGPAVIAGALLPNLACVDARGMR